MDPIESAHCVRTDRRRNMHSFRDLVQIKRRKMLYLILLLALLPFLRVGATINLTYILKRDGVRIQPSCVAEEGERYAAVGWVYPIPTIEAGIPSVTSKFIPTIENNYNCKFPKNDLCTARWLLKDWQVEESSDFLADVRWEDLPTVFVSNATKEVKERVEISRVFRSGVSVRAGGAVELFVCNGWNPSSYPCYYFHLNETDVYLSKYAMLPKDLNEDFKTSYLKYYKAFSSILSHNEWRNFIVSFDENNTLTLFDVNLNRTVIEYTDDEPLTPAYLLMRSSNASLWKFHKNEFLYTNTTQISRLGPQLTIGNKDLCISLLVTTCPNCEMSFFYMNGMNRKMLKNVGPMENGQWMEIKLKEENVPFDKLYIFAETKFKGESLNGSKGFWALDNVRICNENEVKVSFLNLSNVSENETSEEHMSCQLIKKPSWRPKQLTYNKILGFPHISIKRNSTSLALSWAQEDPLNQISYFVTYKGNDICGAEPHNPKRVKSDGFLTTKLNEIVLNGLVPYTLYNITISTVLHEEDRRLFVDTMETLEPTFEELPARIKVLPTETAVFVSWDEVRCTDVYGHLVHTLAVTNQRLNFVEKLEIQMDNSYKIEGLASYTTYTLNITTARNAANINNGIYSSSMVLNFTTLAGVASAVQNLELYSIDENSASLRYDLPQNGRGVPIEVRVTRCNALSFKKCKPSLSNITRCPLWPKKYCVHLSDLLAFQSFNFRVSLRNINTQIFGKEATVQGYTVDRAPGAPTNVTYKVVDCQVSTDYCHLNVSWSHPYFQNGTITTFNIILNSTSKHKNFEEDKYIHEVYKVDNKTYLPTYTYQIKYIPYSTSYLLYVNSANNLYKSNSTTVTVKTDNLGDHIDQSPKLLGNSDSTLVFEIPRLDRRLQSYTLTVIVQDFDRSRQVNWKLLENEKIGKYLCHKFGVTWISQTLTVRNNDTEKIMIGNSEKEKIQPKTKYCITFIITNKYKESEHDVVYYEKLETPEAPPATKQASTSSQYNHLYILLVVLLLVPIGFLIYRYLRKRRVIRQSAQNNENVYESMPFDDCDNNCVSNENYDKLLHK